jgi:uncharacterized membrane protein
LHLNVKKSRWEKEIALAAAHRWLLLAGGGERIALIFANARIESLSVTTEQSMHSVAESTRTRLVFALLISIVAFFFFFLFVFGFFFFFFLLAHVIRLPFELAKIRRKSRCFTVYDSCIAVAPIAMLAFARNLPFVRNGMRLISIYAKTSNSMYFRTCFEVHAHRQLFAVVAVDRAHC